MFWPGLIKYFILLTIDEIGIVIHKANFTSSEVGIILVEDSCVQNFNLLDYYKYKMKEIKT